MRETLKLDARDRARLDGEEGEAVRLAMRVLVRMAAVSGATRFIDITRAHIDSCLYHGQAGLDFANRLARAGARVVVPTTLNVSSLDLLHPGLYRGDPRTAQDARKQMDAYVAMGCRATWTCAPYQLAERPAFGEQIAWAESNAIVFANSVLGARTERYGDFIDICAAIIGRVPDAGLHRNDARRGRVVFRFDDLPESMQRHELLPAVVGHLIGRETGRSVPVLTGLLPEHTNEDALKALGAAAASSGAVALFHAVGITPEAPTVEAALHGQPPDHVIQVTPALLAAARDELSTVAGGRLDAVSLGTPHFSIAEFETFLPRVEGSSFAPGVDVYVSTARDTYAALRERGWLDILERAGITIVVDTCTYITPILRHTTGTVMTNSAKWAYYAPGNLGVDVVFGTVDECIESARMGRVWHDKDAWRGD